jgi:hypothetical protein
MGFTRLITAYTVILRQYDNLRTPKAVGGGRYVCFTDRPRSIPPWETQAFPQIAGDPARNCRIPKCLPHLLLDADISIYMDGAFTPLVSLDRAADLLGDADIALYDHPGDNESYHDERNWYRTFHGYIPDDIERTYQRYVAEGIPADRGWFAGGLVIRRHNERVERFNELWFADYIGGQCSNDQFALYRAVVLSGVKVARIPGIATLDRRYFGYCLHANSGCGDNPKFEVENAMWTKRFERIKELCSR